MTGNDLRAKYLRYFESKNSLVVPSSSLIPTDPTTLLTSAGMQPLVPFFKGEEQPPAKRLASCQKCCRADDIENVGVTWRHASFFEMLGNFSFGDYFKREAINYAWEFLTKDLGIDPKVLWVSVYHDDTEAPDYWKKDIGLSDDRIYRFGKKDNWWGPVGKSGPCGPDSEIFFDRGPKYDTGDPEMDRPGGDGDRYGEIWNLVFQQYNQLETGELVPLPAPGIDTGMGLERTAAILQGVDTIHHTDLFAPLVNAILACRGSKELEFSLSTPTLDPADPTTWPAKVIADHVRAAVFLIGDGVVPGNNGRDYMLRRFIRRAFLTGRRLELSEPFLHRLVPIIVQSYGDVYGELKQRQSIIEGFIREEEVKFNRTISSGIARFHDLVESTKANGSHVLPGEEVFRLYETYGFPKELTEELAREEGLTYDEEAYRRAAERHSKISGSGVGEYEQREFGDLETQFLGYDDTQAEATVVAVKGDRVVLDRSPFYAESGGQIGDTGELVAEGFLARITNTRKEGRTWIHSVNVQEGELREGLKVVATVDVARRRAIERAHSATHLLQAALRQELGSHVAQRGSLVEPDRLRFDFVHDRAVSDEELRAVEDAVNAEILASIPVEIDYKSLEEAKAMGAMALFGEKYGEVVRTVKMGDFSLELCGGTHLPVTSAAGLFRLVHESGVAANVRRVEALTGLAALAHDRDLEQKLNDAARELTTRPDLIVAAAEKMKNRVRDLEKQLAEAQRKIAGSAGGEIVSTATEVKGIKVATGRAPKGLNAGSLRELADSLADKLDGIVVLAAEGDDKVTWAVKASKGAVERGANAGNIVRELAKITGGGGGGRPDFAQAGGKDLSRVKEALERAHEFV